MHALWSTTGKRIRLLRGDYDISQTDLAVAASSNGVYVSQSALSRYEADVTIAPSNAMAAIARALNTTTDYLLMLSDDPNPPNSDDPPPTLAERRVEYTTEEQEILDLWRSLDNEQRDYLRQTMRLVQRWSTPIIIGGET